MTKILTESSEKAKKLEELILQPQSELPEFRVFLKNAGYQLLDENILCEDGKYYFLMKVRYCGNSGKADTCDKQERLGAEGNHTLSVEGTVFTELAERYGELLMQRKDPVLKAYLEESFQNMQQIEETLMANENERARNRLEEIRVELGFLRQALALF